MFRKKVETWMSAGGYYNPTPDVLFISPEKHKLLSKFPMTPSEPGHIVEIASGHDTRLGLWLTSTAQDLFDREIQPQIGRDDVVLPDLIPRLPFSGYGYVIKNGGLIDQAVQVFDLNRTRKIAQLSFLHSPSSLEPGALRTLYPHVRYGHMLDTAMNALLVTCNNEEALTALAPALGFGHGRAGYISLRNTLVTAATIHDGMTVARGDGVKSVDPKAFDEDRLLASFMSLGKYRKLFFDTWSVRRRALQRTIIGYSTKKGDKKKHYLLNDILDLADKLAYISRDVWQYVSRFGYENEIGKIVREDPQVCSLWKSARVIDGQLVVTDVNRLERFLRLRILMFHNIYQGLGERSGEMVLGHCLCGFMYRNGDLNMFQLLANDDPWLDSCMAGYLGVVGAVAKVPNALIVGGAFTSKVEAEEASSLQSLNGHSIKIVERFESLTSSGTRRFRTMKEGSVGSFVDQYPEYATVVDDIHTKHEHAPFRSYGLDLERLGVRKELHAPLIRFAREEMCIH